MIKLSAYEICKSHIVQEYDKKPDFIDKSYLINVTEIHNIYYSGYITLEEYEELLSYNDLKFDEILSKRPTTQGD